jgi:hypothetical protein
MTGKAAFLEYCSNLIPRHFRIAGCSGPVRFLSTGNAPVGGQQNPCKATECQQKSTHNTHSSSGFISNCGFSD